MKPNLKSCGLTHAARGSLACTDIADVLVVEETFSLQCMAENGEAVAGTSAEAPMHWPSRRVDRD